MNFKGIFKDSSFGIQLFFFITFIILCNSFSSVLFYLFLFIKTGFSFETTSQMISAVLTDGNLIREAQFFQSVGTFLLPSLFLAKLYSLNEKEYLQLETKVPGSAILLALLSMPALVPFLNLTVYWNEQLQFPESWSRVEQVMKELETQAQDMFSLMFSSSEPRAIIITFLVIAVIAPIGEEFLFRGVLQNIIGRKIKNHHLTIWIVAILFSAIHLQFYGFVPRMLLGAYFGYLLYYSKSMWIPVLAHFMHNALGVWGNYRLASEGMNEIDTVGTGDTWIAGLISLLVWGALFYLFIRKCRSQNFLP